MRKQAAGWTFVGLAAMAAAVAGSGGAASAPAPAERTMVLDYHDVTLEKVLTDTAQRLDIVFIQEHRFPEPVTIVSGGPVKMDEALGLVNEAVWPLGSRLMKANTSASIPKVVVRILPWRAAVAGDMRIWHWSAPQLPARKTAADFPGVAETATLSLDMSDRLGAILDAMATKWGFAVEKSDLLQRPMTVIAPTPLTAWQAVNLVNDLLSLKGYELEMTAAPAGKFVLAVTQAKPFVKPPVPEVFFKFENAPLDAVLAELSKQSG